MHMLVSHNNFNHTLNHTQVDQPDSPPLLLSGHSKEVTAVSWCPTQPDKVSLVGMEYHTIYTNVPDSIFLVQLATCSDNNDIRLW